MTIYSFSEAQQKFDVLLNRAVEEGKVLIRRNDGRLFSIVPEKEPPSPLDVEGITTNISTDEIIEIIRDSRKS